MQMELEYQIKVSAQSISTSSITLVGKASHPEAIKPAAAQRIATMKLLPLRA